MILESEYKDRRDILASKLSKNSVTVIYSADYKIRSNDTEYPYRQNSNFYYLTGFKEDNSILVILKTDKGCKTLLFVEKKDPQKELWSGKRLGKKEAKKRFLVDKVFENSKFDIKLKEYLLFCNHLYYDFKIDDSKVNILKKYSKNIYTYKNIAKTINKMRLIKSSSEIALIKKAIEITKEAHHKAMKFKKLEKNEYQLQAEIEYIFKKNGAYSDAYSSIVAGGNSANTLHYIDNNKEFVDGDLILIDAGCEYDYYSSDITRIIPVNAKFLDAQKEIYDLVLSVELEIIKMIKPNIKRSKLQKKSEKLLCKGMIELGILKGDYKQLIKDKKHKKYYPHGIGHWMGLDVHDESPYKDENGDEIPLAEGMVLTIEPGIYCDENDKTIPKKYRGIGIRIEDDILVTKNGYENLSAAIAKTVQEIESISTHISMPMK
ncbi:MAG: aminopeptidase P N-terminal domain-containing protein [Campylobacterota bacterium]|nr:aminopeptidase P N-terminal domain-containing protein [Campylobacterota bacterium]